MHSRPRTTALPLLLGATILAAGACGDGGGGGGGPEASEAAVDAVTKVTITPETAAGAFVLADGTYRVTWAAPECASVTVAVAGDTGFAKSKTSTLPKFSWILTSVPAGTYTAAQTDAACTAWEVVVELMSGA